MLQVGGLGCGWVYVCTYCMQFIGEFLVPSGFFFGVASTLYPSSRCAPHDNASTTIPPASSPPSPSADNNPPSILSALTNNNPLSILSAITINNPPSILSAITIGGALYTAVCCAVLEQYGRIAYALSLPKTGEEKRIYEERLEEW